MRVNIYAEEIRSDRVEIIEKTNQEGTFTGIRFYLELPCTIPHLDGTRNVSGPFIHRPGDDDSSAVTFWGKQAMIPLLEKALDLLRTHYGMQTKATASEMQ